MRATHPIALAFLAAAVLGEPLTELKVPERPEGIIEGPGSTLYVSQILSGKVLAIDALTGDTVEVVGEQPEREAWGLWYHEEDDQGYLFVAGGGPSFGNGKPEVYLYNVETGESIVACHTPETSNNETGHGVFINDVAVLDGTAYITNSFSQNMMTLDVEAALAGNCSVDEIFLPQEFVPLKADDWGTNGVVPYDLGNDITGLFVSHEGDGTVFSMQFNPEGTPRYQQVVGQAGALGADGLNYMDGKLYVTQNVQNKIGVFNITTDANGAIFTERIGDITSPDYDAPATSALYDGYIFSTNSRFFTLEDIAAEADNSIIGVKNPFCCDNQETVATPAETGPIDETEEPDAANEGNTTTAPGETGEATPPPEAPASTPVPTDATSGANNNSRLAGISLLAIVSALLSSLI